MVKLWLGLCVLMLFCGFLSNWLGDWIIYVWFISAVLIVAAYCYGNSPPTYLFTGLTLATVYVLAFTDLIYPELGEPRRIEWSLAADLDAYRASSANSEMIYRVDTLRTAEHSAEYERFIRQVATAPHAGRAFVYYEVNPNASHYLFVLALENADGCRLLISDAHGAREEACEHVQFLDVNQRVDPRAIRDPLVAGFVQYRDSGEVQRVFGVTPHAIPAGLPADGTLEDKIWAVFGR